MHNRIKELLSVFFVSGVLFCFMSGCDSGKKAVDEVTGNRALKQYEKSKEDVKAIEEKEKEKYDAVSDEENQENQENK
jgi:hypothetical protein